MDEHLLHNPTEKVLFLRVGPRRDHLIKIVDEGRQHLPVDGRQLQPCPPSFQIPLLGFQPNQPSIEVPNLLAAELGLQRPCFECVEITVNGPLGLRHLVLEPGDLFLQVWFRGNKPLVGLFPDPRDKRFVPEHGLDVLKDRCFDVVRPTVILIALTSVPALAAEVVREPAILLVSADPNHVTLAPGALNDPGEQTLIAVVEPAATQTFGAILQDSFGLVVEDLRYDGLVGALVDRIPPADLADIDGAFDDMENDPLVPRMTGPLPVTGPVKHVANRVAGPASRTRT